MSKDPNGLVDLCFVRSPFEADTIAACLQDRGFRAQAMTIAASLVQWEGGITNTPRVQVPRCELADARAALATVKEQAQTIDWLQVMEDSSAIAAGDLCEHCGEIREAGEIGEVCAKCGRGPTPDVTNARSIAVPKVRWRAKYLLYFGLILICLPMLISLLNAAMRAMKR